MAWMVNIKMWTGLPVEESIRMTEDRDKWRKYGWRTAEEQSLLLHRPACFIFRFSFFSMSGCMIVWELGENASCFFV